jgi:hypothetical protein
MMTPVALRSRFAYIHHQEDGSDALRESRAHGNHRNPSLPAPGNGQRDTDNQEEKDNGLHAWR